MALIHPTPPFPELAFLPRERRVRGTLEGICYYPDPLREMAAVEGYVAPYSERVDPDRRWRAAAPACQPARRAYPSR